VILEEDIANFVSHATLCGKEPSEDLTDSERTYKAVVIALLYVATRSLCSYVQFEFPSRGH